MGIFDFIGSRKSSDPFFDQMLTESMQLAKEAAVVISVLEKEAEEKDQKIASLESLLQISAAGISELEAELKKQDRLLDMYEEEIAELKATIAQQDQKIAALRAENIRGV